MPRTAAATPKAHVPATLSVELYPWSITISINAGPWLLDASSMEIMRARRVGWAGHIALAGFLEWLDRSGDLDAAELREARATLAHLSTGRQPDILVAIDPDAADAFLARHRPATMAANDSR